MPEQTKTERSDAELDALWKTFDLNDNEGYKDAQKTSPHLNTAQPKQSSPLNNLKLFIEKYIPGGRLFLHSFYFPIWRTNLKVANEWQEQLQTLLGSLLPKKYSNTFDCLKNNRVTQLFFSHDLQDLAAQTSEHNDKEIKTSPVPKQQSNKSKTQI